jgi:hypothetical protein
MVSVIEEIGPWTKEPNRTADDAAARRPEQLGMYPV